MKPSNYKLGVALLKKNVLALETLEKALQLKQKEGSNDRRHLAQILVNDFKVDHHRVYKEVASLYGFREIKLTKELLNPNRVKLIRSQMEQLPKPIRTLMEKSQIMIFNHEKILSSGVYKYSFVAVDPINATIPKIALALDAKRYEVCYVDPEGFRLLSETVFPHENEYLKILEGTGIEIQEEDLEDAPLEEDLIDEEINKSLLVHLVEGMLLEAVVQEASDIHLIPVDARTSEIHFRVDGKLRLWHTQKGVRPEAMAAVVKDRSKNIDRFDRETPQDGFIQRNVGGNLIRFRVSVLPIVGKEIQYKLESIVIRVLDDRKVITDFKKLGISGFAEKSFIKSISRPQGMVIITGPTGSGKSTTLVAALSYILKPEINVLTVEDPVEYIIPGVRQLKLGLKNSFENALRSILRHDPDVVMVGEIRDKITADTAIKLANTGHLTFSTLHTNDAPSAVSRLYKMGVETFLIAYAINIIIAQRLMRKLCQKCKRPISSLDKEIPLNLGFSMNEIESTTFYEAVGCGNCTGGYKGRVAIHEALFFSKEVRKLIFTTGAEIDEEGLRQLAIKQGMQTLRASGRVRVIEEVSTLEELAQVTTDDQT